MMMLTNEWMNEWMNERMNERMNEYNLSDAITELLQGTEQN